MGKYLIIVFCFMSIFLVGCGGNDKKEDSTVSNITSQSNQLSSHNSMKSETDVHKKKSVPENFKPISVLEQIIYVPNDIKILHSMSNPTKNVGMAFTGTVWEKPHESKDPLADHYNVAVMFEKNSLLKQMQPFEENEVLEAVFKNAWESIGKTSKVATKHELISKEICTTFDGHKYLKFVSIDGNPSKPNNDMLDKSGIYIFGDTIYFVSVSGMVRANDKYSKTFDLILDSFGVR